MDSANFVRKLRFRLASLDIYNKNPSGQWEVGQHRNVEMTFSKSEPTCLEFFGAPGDGNDSLVIRLDLKASEVRVIMDGSTCFARIGKAPGAFLSSTCSQPCRPQ